MLKLSAKGQILELITNDPEIISGEKMSTQLGLSRVSVWKHIKKLKDLGYDIESSSQGYRLIQKPDKLFPWEFGVREKQIHYFKKVSSTMHEAKQLAQNGCPGGTIVIAEEQTQGRGRLKRHWMSEAGGLYFTIVLRPEIPSMFAFRIHYAVSLVLVQSFQKCFQIPARAKWPNDVLVDEKKISGMITEMAIMDENIQYLNVGIGINMNNQLAKDIPNATTVAHIVGHPVSRKLFLEIFLSQLENKLTDPRLDSIIDEWKTQTITLNRRVKVVTKANTLEGIAIDVDEQGALVIQKDNQTIERAFHGDCFL